MTGSPSNFESQDAAVPNSNPPLPDANMTNDVSGNSDWNCFANGGASDTTGFVKSGITVGQTCSSALVKANAVAKPDPAATTADDSWQNGQKMDSACAQLANNKNQPKDDFTAIASYNEVRASDKHTFLYGATIRVAPNGNASENVELNQVAGTAACPITRTAGDHLLAFDYLNGGATLNLHVLTWIDAAHSTLGGNNGICIIKNDTMPCWGANVITPGAAAFDGGVSQSAITAAKNGINGVALDANEFAEFGVDLTTALDQNPNACNTTSQITWESRASGSSFSSNPADISIEKKTVTNCGEVIIKKHTDPRGVNKSFSYSSDMSGSEISCSKGAGTATSFSLNDNGNTNSDNAANTQDCTNVPAGTVHVTETLPSGWVLESLSCSTGGSQDGTDPLKANITVPAGGSVTCTYTNKQNTAQIATQQSTATGTVFPGTNVTDTATVTGSNSSLNPSGTVSFFLCGPLQSASGCSSSDQTRVSAGTGTLGNGAGGVSTATSSPAVNTSGSPLAAGIYCFEATWPGDTNYPGALDATSATNECFTVSTISTTVVTTPSPGQNGSTTFGDTTVTDSATITAAQGGGGAITGTVTFFLCNPSQLTGGTCPSGGTQVSSTTTLVDQGVSPPKAVAVSSAFTNGGNGVNQLGTWCWRAVYAPGGVNGNNYTGNSDASSTECFTVTDSTSGSSAQTWQPNDSATVAAAHGAPLNGTLSIQLYTGDNCGATSGSAVNGQEYHKTLTNATSAADRTVTSNNTTFSVSTSTSVSWLVTFTSTNANVTGSTHCEKTTLTITN